jgi:hypothetical protein
LGSGPEKTRKVTVEVSDELIAEYFEGDYVSITDADAKTAVQEIFDLGLTNAGGMDQFCGEDAHRTVTIAPVGDGDRTESAPRTVGNDSGASGSRGLESTDGDREFWKEVPGPRW